MLPRPFMLGLLLGALAFTACATARPASARPPVPLDYRVEVPDPQTQYVDVTVRVPDLRGSSVKLAMPAWTPGSYRIRDFAKHVYDLHAERAGKRLRVDMLDKQTWRVEHGGKGFEVHYRVFAGTRSVRTSHIDGTHATLNGASVFLYIPGELDRPANVEVDLPDGWTAHTPLDRRDQAFYAPDYDTLVDSPIELGTPSVHRFKVGATDFEYVLTNPGGAPVDEDRLVTDAKRIVSAFETMMGELPMKRYVFFSHVTTAAGGGLEHANSTMMMMPAKAFDSARGYERAARLLAHEFFHLWNVKRIHDSALGPFAYDKENRTDLLWFHEGFTETMEAQALRRSGLWTEKQFLDHIAASYTKFRQRPGRNHTPIADLSAKAWTVAYQPEPNHRNVAVSYYDKGDLIGILLDLELRYRSRERDTPGSLVGVFRRLMASHGRLGHGITELDIIAAASAEAGDDMSGFFARYVHGTHEVELKVALGRLGVDFSFRAPWEPARGKARDDADPVAENAKRAWAGWHLDATKIESIDPGSPAAGAKLQRGDELVAIDGRRVASSARVAALLGRIRPGTSAELHLFRHGRLVAKTITVGTNPHRIYKATKVTDEDAPAGTLALRNAWLGATTATSAVLGR